MPAPGMNAAMPTTSRKGLPDPTVGRGPQRAYLVPTTFPHNMHPAWNPNGADVLWTMGLSDCVAVATWHIPTGRRSLTHPNAGDVTAAWASELAMGIDDKTVVIIANGTNQLNPVVFQSGDFARISNAIKQAMRAQNKRNPQFWMYFTPGNPAGVRMDTFVMYANGMYGRIGNTNTDVPARMAFDPPRV